MASAVINQYGLTLHDVNTEIKQEKIEKLLRRFLPNGYIKTNPGKIYYKNGAEMRRIYIKLDKPSSVDVLMKNRSTLRFNKKQIRVTRMLPKSYIFYDRCVTGLKIKIHPPNRDNLFAGTLSELDLKKHFRHLGRIVSWQWLNTDRTEALFTFSDYDSVDQIILSYPSLNIKGNRIELEKSRTTEDLTTYERSYVIHVTNLPMRVTSEEVSAAFEVPIAVILLYPCYQSERSRLVGGRSSSEAWIKNVGDEKIARALAESKTGTIVRTHKIQCEAMLESINEGELCKHFQIGQCFYTANTCHYKHFSCSEPDTCDDEYCWLGHTSKRTTVSIDRLQRRLENAHYRLRFHNLPFDVTREVLMARLNIEPKYSQYLTLQPAEENSESPRMAYLVRQPLENRLRQLIDKYHGTSLSSLMTQKIQCQLEINQGFFEWNESNDMVRPPDNNAYASPALSSRRADSNRTNPAPLYSTVATTKSYTSSTSKNSHRTEHSQIPRSTLGYPPTVTKKTTNSLKSKSIVNIRQPPSDWSSLSTGWNWTKEMMPNDQYESDQLYWIEFESNKEQNVVTKIYLPINDRIARVRAQRECVALDRLNGICFVPKMLNSNVDATVDRQSKKELWTNMKLINGERLCDYIELNKADLGVALQITRRLLNMIKQIHVANIVHRDIQPKNILVEQRPNHKQIDVMIINFSSAWINDYQWTYSMEDYDQMLSNSFCRMPQFEQQHIQNNQKIKQFQRSPTIDATGIGAILFWLITGHEPREAQDIGKEAPHKLRDHLNAIEKRINEVTAIQTGTGVSEHLHKHLMLIFDRTFDANPEQQWSVVELDYQLQLMLALVEVQNGRANSFLSSPHFRADQVLLPSIPWDDPFVYIVSLIYQLKTQFVARYSQWLQWSTEEKNRWHSYDDGRVEHDDLLIVRYKTKNLSIDIHWNVIILKEKHFSISIQGKSNEQIDIELPLGSWEISERTNDFHLHLNSFEMEMKILINILCQSIAS